MKHNHRASPPITDDDRPLSHYIRSNNRDNRNNRNNRHNRYHYRESRPLIDQVSNAWKSEKSHGYTSDSDDDEITELVHCCDLDTEESFLGAAAAISRTRRFRRGLLAFLIVVSGIWSIYRVFYKVPWEQDRILVQGFNEPLGTFGMQEPPMFKGMTQIQELEAEYIPGGRHDQEGKRRLVFIGDIHGCKKELLKLLDKVGFRKETDHLVCTGDVIAKGPDSLGVVDTLMELNASSVRGNHEDKVLLARDQTLRHPSLDKKARKEKAAGLKGEDLAPYFFPEQRAWLQSLPIILHVPALNIPAAQAPARQEAQMDDSEDEEDPEAETAEGGVNTDPSAFSKKSKKKDKKRKKKKSKKPPHVPDITTAINIVHGGLVPGLPLTRQDPYAVMNMRSMSPSSHVPSRERDKGVPWEHIWGWYNDRLDKHRNPKKFSWFAEDYEIEVGSESGAEDSADGGAGEDSSTAAVTAAMAKAKVENMDAEDEMEGWKSWFSDWFGHSAKMKLKVQPPSVVVYGHDSPRGLNLHRWSKGLDSGCVRGGQLTALVVDAWGQAYVVQVKCKGY